MPAPFLSLLQKKESRGKWQEAAQRMHEGAWWIKEATIQDALPNYCSKTESLIEQQHFEYKSYFHTAAVISHLHFF